MLDKVLIDNANTLVHWQRRAYTAEARVEELEARVEELEALMEPVEDAEIIGE